MLVAIGVEAQTDGLLASGVKLELDRGYLKTNDRYETSIKGIYGAGDIIGPPWLAHVASHEAIEAVEGLFVPGKKPHKVTVFPGCTYCQPQVASIGITEKVAKEKGLKYKVGKFPYKASGKAVAAGDSEGFVKLILGDPHGEILGAHIIGADATELIAEIGLAIAARSDRRRNRHPPSTRIRPSRKWSTKPPSPAKASRFTSEVSQGDFAQRTAEEPEEDRRSGFW